jgi:hypothetical protein
MVVFSRLAVPASKLLRQGFQTGIVQVIQNLGRFQFWVIT